MKTWHTAALWLLVIGGLNWGLVGLIDVDVVAMLFGDMSMISRTVYILVGLAALYEAVRPFMSTDMGMDTDMGGDMSSGHRPME